MIPVVIFVRVSTQEQNYQRQITELEEYARYRQYHVVALIKAKVSGYKKNSKRLDVEELLTIARAGTIRKVLLTEVSRLGRNARETEKIRGELDELGVSIYCKNLGMETLDEQGKRKPLANLLFGIQKEYADYERELLRERIISGQQEARRQGKHIGRKAGSVKSQQEVLSNYPRVVKQLKEGNNSIREIAAICGVSKNTVSKVKALLID